MRLNSICAATAQIISFIFLIQPLHAQEPKNINQSLEQIIEQNENAEEFNTHYEDLLQYKEHPININTASYEELIQSNVFSARQVMFLVRYRKKYGIIRSVYELLYIESFDQATLDFVQPLISVDGEVITIKNDFEKPKPQQDLFIRSALTLQAKEGYKTSGGYVGAPSSAYLRYKYKLGNAFQAGATLESDAGEYLLNKHNYYLPDFYSAHLYWKGEKKIKTAIIGDYHLRLGQGLAMWTGLGFGKTSMSTDVIKQSDFIKPYTSSEENNFLRGIATTINFRNVAMTPFFSGNKVDANILNNAPEVSTISTLQTTGLHRTENELADKDAVNMTTYGVDINYQLLQFKIGIRGLHTQLSDSLNMSDKLYKQYDFRGKSNDVVSFDYKFINRKLEFFGENAVSRFDTLAGWAAVNGVKMYLDSRITMVLMHRYYSKAYHSFWSNGFREGSNTANESGVYLGMEGELFKHTNFFHVFRCF